MRATPRDLTAVTLGLAGVVAITGALAGSGGAVGSDPAGSAGWPQFRGPQRDGISREAGLLDRWPETGPVELWRVALGEGYSGISIYKGRLFTIYGDERVEYAICLDAATGKKIWKRPTGPNWKDRMGNGPRSTPTVASGIVYVLGASGKLHALNAGDGAPLWTRDLVAEYGAELPQWGVSTSPLVEGDLLVVDAGAGSDGSILAFNKRTGELAWRTFEDKAGYSAPIAVTVDGTRQIVVFTGRSLVGLAPDTGSVLWRQRWKTSWDVNAATPVFMPPDRLFISSGYDVGAAVFRINGSDGEFELSEVWRSREMKNQFSSSIVRDGYAYGFDDNLLKCVNVRTGERMWRQRGFGHGSLIWVDGRLVVLSDDGLLALIEATPDGYREIGRAKIFTGKTWTGPSYADGRLYLRDESQLVALRLGESSETRSK